MNQRKILTIATVAIALTGFIFVATPFIVSMFPNEVAKSAAKVRITMSEVPANGALVADYQWYKAFVIRRPELNVFLMPYFDGAYHLPDTTWERPIIPCENFIVSDEGFSCEDPLLHESWNKQATWNLTGKNQGTWMPDLQTANFRIEGKYLVLSPEYK